MARQGAASRYARVYKPGHPNARPDGSIYAHVFVMSEILGRPLKEGEVVHHEDEDTRNNTPGNLMLFESQAEHLLYHAKARALEACGDASFMKCCHCKEYDNPSNMKVSKTAYAAYHIECKAKYSKEYARLKKLKSL